MATSIGHQARTSYYNNGAGVSVTTADAPSGCYDLWGTGSGTAYATGTLGSVFRATAR